MAPVTPCLWFDGNAAEAVDFYVALFPNAERFGDDNAAVMITFELDGRPFMALNGGPMYTFTPAISLVVNCETQDEVDHYWDGLLDGGEPGQCGWLTDRFGVSWQIVPNRLGELMSDPDPERSGRVMQAMLQMIKLDIAQLEAAAAGA
jgi:predicted 3-demethylubiquinone-9 3-methyltransferase (glyoxalase superfamily)